MDFEKITLEARQLILDICKKAGSGHPTSCLSALNILVYLFFSGIYNTNWENWSNISNDQFILSKGHASALIYSMYNQLGLVEKSELMTYRTFDSNWEGHPTPRNKLTNFTTGSLGMGIGIGAGVALSQKLNKLNSKTYILCGDSELAEGSNWEAVNFIANNSLKNAVILVDINRLGQRGETMEGWDIDKYKNKFVAFGLNVIICENGHDYNSIKTAFDSLDTENPNVLLFKTIKGNSLLEVQNKNGYHGKVI